MKQIYSKMLLLIAMILVGGSAWAASPWSVTSFSGTITDNSLTVNEAKWSLSASTVGAGEPSWSITSKKLKFGASKTAFFSSYTLSTDFFTDVNVTKVVVGCYDNGGTESSVTVKQGSITIGTATVSTTTATNSATLDAAKGEGGTLSITFESTKQASYITSITVYYLENGQEEVPVTGVSLDKTTANVDLYKTIQLTATVAPDNATNKTVKWTSSDEKIATVTNGTVRGISAGNVTITATTDDGNIKATCEVTVNPKQIPAGNVFYESFDKFDGTGGNDEVWSNISNTKDMGIFDNEGWTSEGSVMSGYQCASIRKVDASTPSGLTTPAIGTAVPYGKVVFMAESWGTDGSNFFVDIIGDGKFADGTTTSKVAMLKTGNWTTFTLYVNGLAADSKLRFYAPANKRAFLDEVSVTPITSTEFTMGAAEYATYVTPCAIDFSESGVKAYVVSSVSDENVTLTEVTKVPACKPVVLNAPEGTYTFNAIASADEVTNKMIFSTGDIKYSSTAEKTYYVLALEGGNVVFAPVISGTIAAGKGYFTVSKDASSAKTLSFTIEDATSISKVVNVVTEGVVFNVAGQRVDANYKGIIIKNGKKYINK